MTRGRRPVVAVDLDDTCADRLGVIADRLRSEGVDVPARQPAEWNLSDWGVRNQAHYDRLHYDAFVYGDGYREMSPLPGAIEAIQALHDEGYLIRIVSGRLWASQVVVPALSGTALWLAKHQVPADDVVFVSDKTAIQADVYLEDAPHFITDLQRVNRAVIIMDAPYNRRLPGPRASSWAEIPELISRLSSGMSVERPSA